MRRLLIIDDEDHIREIAQVSLEMVGGWDVLTASCGSDGIAQAEVERPDAILLDVMMPEMDGPTTFRELQASPVTRQIPVILLTAKVQPAERRGFAELGVHGVLAKPFDPIGLPGQVAELLGWQP